MVFALVVNWFLVLHAVYIMKYADVMNCFVLSRVDIRILCNGPVGKKEIIREIKILTLFYFFTKQ